MTKGAFACALNYIDDRLIAKAISNSLTGVIPGRKRINLACLRKPAIVAACFALALVMVIGVFKLFQKGKNYDPGFSVISNQPQINYSVAVSTESRSFDVNEDIPIIVHVGSGGLGDSIEELKIWSESVNIRIKDNDPLILRAESNDFESAQFEFDKSVYYKENKKVDDLPYKLPVSLVVFKTGDNVLGQIDITVQLSGTGFHQAQTVTLYYSIRGARIAFSTVSAEDADSYLY